MLKHSRQVQRLMFLFAIVGLFAVTADFACLEDVCADSQMGAYRTMGDISKERIRTLGEALAEQRRGPDARIRSTRSSGTVSCSEWPSWTARSSTRTVEVEMAANWLPPIPEGHPWRKSPHARRRRLLLVRRGADLPGQAVRPAEPGARARGAGLPGQDRRGGSVVHRLDGRVAHRVREDQGRRGSAGHAARRDVNVDRRRSGPEPFQGSGRFLISRVPAPARAQRQRAGLCSGARPSRAATPAASSRQSTRARAASNCCSSAPARSGSPRSTCARAAFSQGRSKSRVQLACVARSAPAPAPRRPSLTST